MNWIQPLQPDSTEDILGKVDDNNFLTRKNILQGHEELEKEQMAQKNVVKKMDKRYYQSRDSTAKSYSVKVKGNKTGVTGVSLKTRPNGSLAWTAKIQYQNHNIHLYYGPSFEKAVELRKKAEQKYKFYNAGGKKCIDKSILPRGVRQIKLNARVVYRADYYSLGMTHKLYQGPSLEQAIFHRKEWEIKNGFEGNTSKTCVHRNRKVLGATGIKGVYLQQNKYWVAHGQRFGVIYTLYHGKNKEVAIRARERWERDPTRVKARHVPGGNKRAVQILQLCKKHPSLTSTIVSVELKYNFKSASSQLCKMHKRGLLKREKKGYSYHYTKLDKDEFGC